MTPLPKRKHTRARTGKRRNASSNMGVLPNLTICSSCKKLKEAHKACPFCGFYPTKTASK